MRLLVDDATAVTSNTSTSNRHDRLIQHLEICLKIHPSFRLIRSSSIPMTDNYYFLGTHLGADFADIGRSGRCWAIRRFDFVRDRLDWI